MKRRALPARCVFSESRSKHVLCLIGSRGAFSNEPPWRCGSRPFDLRVAIIPEWSIGLCLRSSSATDDADDRSKGELVRAFGAMGPSHDGDADRGQPGL